MSRSILPGLIAFLVLILGVASLTQGAESHVKASLIADVSAIQPAKPFTIGVWLEIDPGWHIYWTNPGDSGLATVVKFKLPAGFTVAADPFPVPLRIQQPGNEVVYGYENAVLITAKVTPPADLHVGDDVAITATASWLVCQEACLPGKASVNLTMKVADHADTANVDTFATGRSTVTPAGQPSADFKTVSVATDPTSHMAMMTVHWNNPVTDVDLFPFADDAVAVSKISVDKTENGITKISLKVDVLAGQKPKADNLPVLIAYHDARGHTRGFEASIHLP